MLVVEVGVGMGLGLQLSLRGDGESAEGGKERRSGQAIERGNSGTPTGSGRGVVTCHGAGRCPRSRGGTAVVLIELLIGGEQRLLGVVGLAAMRPPLVRVEGGVGLCEAGRFLGLLCITSPLQCPVLLAVFRAVSARLALQCAGPRVAGARLTHHSHSDSHRVTDS